MVHIYLLHNIGSLLLSKPYSFYFGVSVHYTIYMSYGCIICTNIIQVPKAQILAQPKPEEARPKFTFGMSRAMWFRVWLDPSFTHTVGLASKRIQNKTTLLIPRSYIGSFPSFGYLIIDGFLFYTILSSSSYLLMQ